VLIAPELLEPLETAVGTAVAAAVVLPEPELLLVVVTLSSSPPQAAKISREMPIKTGNVNFCNFLIELPPLLIWPHYCGLNYC